MLCFCNTVDKGALFECMIDTNKTIVNRASYSITRLSLAFLTSLPSNRESIDPAYN